MEECQRELYARSNARVLGRHCSPSDGSNLDELEYWWQRVGTEAHTLEEGLVRFETYRVPGEEALIIHETFTDTSVLKFHLAKGTAAIFKDDIDKIAAPVQTPNWARIPATNCSSCSAE